MSRMSQIATEIQELLQDGHKPEQVSKRLGVPLSWVYAELESIMESDEPLAGYVSD